MKEDMISEGINTALGPIQMTMVVCVSVVTIGSLWAFIMFSSWCCCPKRQHSDNEDEIDEEHKLGSSQQNKHEEFPTDAENVANYSTNQTKQTNEEIEEQITASTNVETLQPVSSTSKKSEKKTGLFTKKENKKNTGSHSEKNVPVKERINVLETTSSQNPDIIRHKDGTKPKKKKPTSKAFQEFESRGIMIGFGNMPRKRVHSSEEREDENQPEGGYEQDADEPRSKVKIETQLSTSKSTDHGNNSNTNSLSRLTDDEGIHTMDEEDEFAAVARNSEVLKSFRRAPPPKNRSKARRSLRTRITARPDMMDFPGFDFPMEMDEQLADSEYSTGTTPSHSTDSIVTPSDRATPDNDNNTSGHCTSDDSPRRSTPDFDGSGNIVTSDAEIANKEHPVRFDRSVSQTNGEKPEFRNGRVSGYSSIQIDSSSSEPRRNSEQSRNRVSGVRNNSLISRQGSSDMSTNSEDKHVVLVIDSGSEDQGQKPLKTRKCSTKEVNEVSFHDFMGLIQRSNSRAPQSPSTHSTNSGVSGTKVSLRMDGTTDGYSGNHPHTPVLSGNDTSVSCRDWQSRRESSSVSSSGTDRDDRPLVKQSFSNDPNMNNNNVIKTNTTAPRNSDYSQVNMVQNVSGGKLVLTRPRSFHPTNFTRSRDSPSRSSMVVTPNTYDVPTRARFMSTTTATPGQERLGAERSRSLSVGSPKFLRKWESEFSGLEARKKMQEDTSEDKTEDDQSVENRKKVFQETAL